MILRIALALCLAWLASDSSAAQPPGRENEPARLPSGKSQSEEILKADYKANLADLLQMQKLIDEVKTELEKNDRHVLSLSNMKKLEELETLSRKIRGRMRRW